MDKNNVFFLCRTLYFVFLDIHDRLLFLKNFVFVWKNRTSGFLKTLRHLDLEKTKSGIVFSDIMSHRWKFIHVAFIHITWNYTFIQKQLDRHPLSTIKLCIIKRQRTAFFLLCDTYRYIFKHYVPT